MDIKLNIALLSHLSDIHYDRGIYGSETRVKVRLRFIHSLIFHNEDTSIWISQGYLDFMWEQAEERKGMDCSYEEWVTMQECELVK